MTNISLQRIPATLALMNHLSQLSALAVAVVLSAQRVVGDAPRDAPSGATPETLL